MIASQKGVLGLPSNVAAALQTMQWPLDHSPRMQYLSLPKMVEYRVKNHKHTVANGLIPETWDIFLGDKEECDGVDGIAKTINDLGGSDYARIAVGLLLLGGGATDECHSLVLPLSWDEDMHIGWGPARTQQAKMEASYAHALVHRREGPNMGEFNMIGWNNAHFWSRATYSADRGSDHLGLWREVRQGVLDLAKGIPEAETWCQDHIVDDLEDNEWEVRALTELCSWVVADRPEAKGLHEFASKAARLELEILTRHCLREAGYITTDVCDLAEKMA